MRHKGVTLLEVIIVIAIVVVIIGITIFALRPATIFKDTKDSKRQADKESIQKGINTYVSEKKTYPSTFLTLAEGIYDICKQGQSNCTLTSVNIDEIVTAGYLSKVPVDPDCNDATDTCYNIQYIPLTNEIVVLTEDDDIISVPTPTPTATPPVPSQSPTPTPPPPSCYQVSAGTDDAEEVLGTGNISLTGSTLDLGESDINEYQAVGFRFNNIALSQGQTITSASLNLTGNGTSFGNLNLVVKGQKIANAPTFANTSGNISSRTTTTSSVNWSGIPSWSDGVEYTSPDLANVIQEVVNQGSWAANNSLALIVTGIGNNRDASSFENSAAEAAELCINTQSASTPSPLTADVIINGTNDNDGFGGSVIAIGDVNNDNIEDILVGAPLAEDTGISRGRVYIFYGRASWPGTINAENADVIINGTNDNDQFGYSVSTIADVNDDNFEDIIVGAPYAEDAGTNRGRAYVFYGDTNLPASINAENADIILNGTNDNDKFGFSVAGLDNLYPDPDGADEWMVGAPYAEDTGTDRGRAYIFYGAENSLPASINAENADVTLNGTNNGDLFGYSMAYLENIGNGSTHDFAIGAPFAEDTGSDRGRGYIQYGSTSLPSTINAESMSVIINGTNDGDQFGFSVVGTGDVNDDNYDETLFGAPFAEDTGSNRGRAYVINGASGALATTVNAENANVILNGTNDGDQFGFALGEAGDLDDDGNNDIVVGAPFMDGSGSDRGAGYVYLGKDSMPTSINAESMNLIVNGVHNNDQLGKSVTGKNDLNGDGFDDILFGAPYDEDTGTDRGRLYVYLYSF